MSSGERPEGPLPVPRGLTLEPVVRSARTRAVTALAASPWAPVVAVGGQRQVFLYDVETNELCGVLPFLEGTPHVLKFSRNGSLLPAGGGRGAHSGRVVVWDVTTGDRLLGVGEEFDSVLAADISADHGLIALGGSSRVVRVYSTADGELLREIRKHTNWTYTLEFSLDGVLLASADRNGGLHVRESLTGPEYLALSGHGGVITDVSWRSESNALASSSAGATSASGRWRTAGRSRGGTRKAVVLSSSTLRGTGASCPADGTG